VNDTLDTTAEVGPPPDVDVRALAGPTTDRPEPAPSGRRALLLRVAIAALVGAVAGGGLWWHETVTADPGLEFYGGFNVYRDPAATDMTGIDSKRNLLGTESDVAFVPGGRFYATIGLYNGGHHDVRIEAEPTGRYYYWALDHMSVAHDPEGGFAGFDRRYQPFRPFTLHHGETRDVRLEFRIADCDPNALESGGTSSLDGLPLRYRTFGITRNARAPFRDAVLALEALGECRNPITD